jgi:rubrerythrin
MVGELFGGISAFKSMIDMAAALQNIHDAVARERAVFDLQREILAAQAQQMSLVETVGELKKRLAEFETWECEKLRYELKNTGYSSFVYQLRPAERGETPPHWVCTNCFEHRHIAIIQLVMEIGKGQIWRCPSCKNTIDPGVGATKWVD